MVRDYQNLLGSTDAIILNFTCAGDKLGFKQEFPETLLGYKESLESLIASMLLLAVNSTPQSQNISLFV